MADVQTTEADVITSNVHVRLMLLPVIAVCGRCYTTSANSNCYNKYCGITKVIWSSLVYIKPKLFHVALQ